MSKNNICKEIIIKNINLETFLKNTGKLYDIEIKDKTKGIIKMPFAWEEYEETELSYFSSDRETINKKIHSIKAKISSNIKGEIEIKKIPVVIIEKGSDLVLILKTDATNHKKIMSKLLGQSTTNPHIKDTWKNYTIKNPETIFKLDFLIWLIDMYYEEKEIKRNNISFKVINIPYISDKGIYLEGLQRKGRGEKLINDPIIKAIIAVVDTIDTLGLRVKFEGGCLEFILHENGEFDINNDSYFGGPITFNIDSDYGYERMAYFIKEIIIENLIREYENDNDWDKEKVKKIKLNHLCEMLEEISEILNIKINKNVEKNTDIKEITLK